MLCEQCKQREATTHIRRVVNGAAEEHHLCTDCAREAGLYKEAAMPDFGFHLSDLFSGFLGSSVQNLPAAARCEFCGSSMHEIVKHSRVGCAQCYDTFREQLQPTLQRIHGAQTHKGKIPAESPEAMQQKQKEQEIARLRAEIAAAVQAEQYEQAAALRDEIRNIEEGGESNA